MLFRSYCICRDLSKGLTTFHGVDMVKRCAKGFLDEQGVDQYQFSGEHEYYKHVLERIYRPLVDFGLLVEYENNNFGVHNNRLHDICRKELDGKGCIKWDGFLRTELSEIQ